MKYRNYKYTILVAKKKKKKEHLRENYSLTNQPTRVQKIE